MNSRIIVGLFSTTLVVGWLSSIHPAIAQSIPSPQTSPILIATAYTDLTLPTLREGDRGEDVALLHAVTVGADEAFYVSELTGYPLQAGAARIYRLDAAGQPEVYADGFTNIVDLAADQCGGFYVLEYDSDGILTGSNAGVLIYLSPDGKTRTTITNELVSPTGLTIGADGDLYISNKGFVAGQGEVLRLSLEQDNPFSSRSPIEQAMVTQSC
jgi:hypothetical protein